jgi:hypothetical protein
LGHDVTIVHKPLIQIDLLAKFRVQDNFELLHFLLAFVYPRLQPADLSFGCLLVFCQKCLGSR